MRRATSETACEIMDSWSDSVIRLFRGAQMTYSLITRGLNKAKAKDLLFDVHKVVSKSSVMS